MLSMWRAVPDGFEDGVAEPQDQDVLDGFLPQIMVDAVDLVFVELGGQDFVEFLGGGQIPSKGFLDDDAAVPPVGLVQPGLAEVLDDGGVVVRRCGKVEELSFPGFHQLGQLGVPGGVAEGGADEVQLLQEGLFLTLGDVGVVPTREHAEGLFLKTLLRPGPPGEPDDLELGGISLQKEGKQRGDQLLPGQVSGGAENRDDEGGRFFGELEAVH